MPFSTFMALPPPLPGKLQQRRWVWRCTPGSASAAGRGPLRQHHRWSMGCPDTFSPGKEWVGQQPSSTTPSRRVA